MTWQRIPAATYRFQFNRHFRLPDATALVPYLHQLGITDLYVSPVLKARRESTHGYDVTDPTRLNPELGGEEAFTALAETLQQHGMGLLLDVVPNHMAASTENPWWTDVLRNGPDSPYSPYFDINWNPSRPGMINRVLLPILGTRFVEVLENRELVVVLVEDGFQIHYHEWHLPLNLNSHYRILAYWLEDLADTAGPAHPVVPQLKSLVLELERLLTCAKQRTRRVSFEKLRRKIWNLYTTHLEIKAFIDEKLKELNGKSENSLDLLCQILDEQYYRLTFWKVAGQEINYRRFFNISELVSMHTEDERVFAATHNLIFQLVEAGYVTGLRIDHLDGLYDPWAYLYRLQDRTTGDEKTNSRFYVVVEKILCGDEELPHDWPVCGTTGYDFLNAVNGLFVDGYGVNVLGELYARLSGCGEDFAGVVREQKRKVMKELFAGEIKALTQQLGRLAERDRFGHDLTLAELEQALIEVTACFPVYRTYIRNFTVADRDRPYIERAVTEALKKTPHNHAACEFLRRVLLLEFPPHLTGEQKRAWLHFVMRWQQFTGPIMAKGFEDTALYVYNRLVSLNEVGGEPQKAAVSVTDFHRRNLDRRERWPHTLNATSTHDTKRSEDVRARINVLSEISNEWMERLTRWILWNQPKKPELNGRPLPDDNMELLIYQTLVGAWPLREEEVPSFKERLRGYLIKAAREAKIYTCWTNPNSDYENAVVNFTETILTPAGDNHFLADFIEFQKVVAYYGAFNSLSQVLLKIASPGVPDFYQGTELWDFSLVDPDNRRPVDFQTRTELLAQLREQEAIDLPSLVRELLARWEDGRIKLYLTYKSLHFRRDNHELFSGGDYIPLENPGPLQENVCAFARHLGESWVVTAVPRFPARLQSSHRVTEGKIRLIPPLGEETWGEAALILPEHFPVHWHNVLTGETVSASLQARSKKLFLSDLFRIFPVALMAGV